MSATRVYTQSYRNSGWQSLKYSFTQSFSEIKLAESPRSVLHLNDTHFQRGGMSDTPDEQFPCKHQYRSNKWAKVKFHCMASDSCDKQSLCILSFIDALEYASSSPTYFVLLWMLLEKHPLCHRMCKVTKETLGASNIMRNAIDWTSITFRWSSSSSRQSVFSTTSIAKKTEENGSQSRRSDYLVKIGPWTSELLLG